MVHLSSRFTHTLALALFVAAAGCGGPGNGGDAGGEDATMMGDAMDDAPIDGRRQRDGAVEITTDSPGSECYAEVTPSRGTAATNFTAMGRGFPMGDLHIEIAMAGTTAGHIFDAMVTTTPDTMGTFGFTYMFSGTYMGTPLAPGDYIVRARDPLMTCTYEAPFRITL
jgi:hypothetical protein